MPDRNNDTAQTPNPTPSEDNNRVDDFEIFTWSDVPDLKNIQFSGNPGLTVPVPGDKPFDFFLCW